MEFADQVFLWDCLFGAAGFPLMSQRQYQYDIRGFRVLVQRNVSRVPARNHELTQIVFHRSPDKRMALKYANRFLNDHHCSACSPRLDLEQELEYAFEIIQCLPRVDYFRHVRDFGRAGVLPPARALM
jgi:hypothetical protein